MTTTSKGQRASAVITSASGKRISLLRLNYPCFLPPQPDYYPPKHVTVSKHSDAFAFSGVRAGVPLQLAAVVGPIKTPKRSSPPVSSRSLIAPPYVPTELAEVVTPPPPGSSKSAKPTATTPLALASARARDTVVLLTRLTATAIGAPQRVTVTLEQGPARSIRVSATILGGRTASATIKSAANAPIAVVSPHYPCSPPPTPTFCPATKVIASHHRYVLTFMTSPAKPPVHIIATVQAGWPR